MKQRGYTLVEMVIYVALLAMLVGVVVTVLLGIVNSYKHIEVSLDLQRNTQALDRIVRELQSATTINDGSSTFDSSPGTLVYTTFAGDTRTVDLSGDSISLSENGSALGNLTTGDVVVTNMVFRYLNGFFSDAIKIEMTMEAGSGDAYRSESFSVTTVVRGSIDD